MTGEPALELWPFMSVVIPTINRDKVLVETARYLKAQRYDRWECIVVIQGDFSSDLVTRLNNILGERLRVFFAREPNASLARNIGLIEARGDVVLFLDDDVQIPSTSFLQSHARHFFDPATAGVAGRILPPGPLAAQPKRTIFSRSKRLGWLFFSQTANHPMEVLNGGSGNLSVRRQYAIEVGGMDAHYEKGAHREESDFCLRYTAKFGPLEFDPDASLVHLGEPVGGCRNWGHNSGVHPLHHVTGEWYFILNGLSLGTIRRTELPLHIVLLIYRQILNIDNRGSPLKVLAAIKASLAGYRAAKSKLASGRRQIGTVTMTDYDPIGSANQPISRNAQTT